MKLDVGSGPNPKEGYVGLDRVEGPGVVVCDLNSNWPIESGSVEHLLAKDILEHLTDKNHSMSEIERVLQPGGTAEILVPSTDGPGAFQDPTHVSYWNEYSFYYYDLEHPDYLALNQRYGYTGRGFEALRCQTVILPGSLPRVCHVDVLLRRPAL